MEVPPSKLARNRADPGPAAALVVAALVGAAVLAAALFGIFTRPIGALAAIWPANAVLLGLLIRFPALATRAGLLGAVAGFLAADLLTGSDALIALWLTTVNLIGVGVAYALLSRLSRADRRLESPQAVLRLLLAALVGAVAEGFVGGGVQGVLTGRFEPVGIVLWAATELVNFMVVLPLLLTLPARSDLLRVFRRHAEAQRRPDLDPMAWRRFLTPLAPLAALALSIVAAIEIGGPGAIAFPLPAMLWCALTYPLFVTAFLAAIVSSGTLLLSINGSLALPMGADPTHSDMSLRFGVMLLALGPLTVASSKVVQGTLLKHLSHAASHDSLTGVLSRSAWLERGERLIDRARRDGVPSAVMMIDLDHFKQVNDNHGHATGDRLLEAFTRAVTGTLRPADLLGRTGGEEFAVVLHGPSNGRAMEVAERILQAVRAVRIGLAPDSGPTLGVTASIGVACTTPPSDTRLDALLKQADLALYQAKAAGRDRAALARLPATAVMPDCDFPVQALTPADRQAPESRPA